MDLLYDAQLHRNLSICLLIISLITYFILTKIVAPFGKHTSSNQNIKYNWGPSLNPKLAWFLFESPNLLWCLFAYQHRNKDIFDGNNSSNANVILFSIFAVHYVNRCFIYPLQMRKGSTPVNLAVIFSAFVFCSLNGL